MFRKVLIANRGAIACRVLRTLRRMGIASVAVYSEADRHAAHVEQADEAYLLGPAQAAQSYLLGDKIIAIALECGAEAIHPGYGFLSENADFAEACSVAGIKFIGPSPEQMRAFGLKHRARELAVRANVPLLPGTALLSGVLEALSEANRIGYPVMLKSTAGGGGIGMRLCRDANELQENYASVERLSLANFKDGGLFLEKYVERARHVEVQIFGDGAGNVTSWDTHGFGCAICVDVARESMQLYNSGADPMSIRAAIEKKWTPGNAAGKTPTPFPPKK